MTPITESSPIVDLRVDLKKAGFATVEHLAAVVGCSPATLYAAISEGRMPHNKAIAAAVKGALERGAPADGFQS